MSRFHNQNLHKMELYAYKDYNWMMDLVEEMVEKTADFHGKPNKGYDNLINFKDPEKIQYV